MSWSPLVTALFSSDTLKGLECLRVEITFWMIDSMVGKVTVGKKKGRSINCNMSKRPSEIVSVRSNRVVDARKSKWNQNCEIYTIRALGHCHELLKLRHVEGDWIPTEAR
jgi:hypothetical protein